MINIRNYHFKKLLLMLYYNLSEYLTKINIIYLLNINNNIIHIKIIKKWYKLCILLKILKMLLNKLKKKINNINYVNEILINLLLK